MHPSPNESDGTLTDDEIARRRDEVIRRMANTPPQPKPTKAKDASPKNGGRPPQANKPS